MSINFRKRVSVAPGVKLNFSKNGVSTTVGVKGASVNVGKNGAYLNTSIPGTGLYSRQKISSFEAPKTSSKEVQQTMPIPDWLMWVCLVFWMLMSIVFVLFPNYEKAYIFLIAAGISLILFWILWLCLKDE